MKNSLLFFLLLAASGSLWAQTKELKRADDALAMFGDKTNTITKASVQTETEKTLGVQIEFTGFKEKAYKIKAAVLNSARNPMKEVEPQVMDLDSRAGLADFFFTFKQQPGKQYAQAYAESAYVQFSISDKNAAGSDLGLDALGIGSKVFLFQYKKKWKLKGGAGKEVVVTLTPYKGAASIKP